MLLGSSLIAPFPRRSGLVEPGRKPARGFGGAEAAIMILGWGPAGSRPVGLQLAEPGTVPPFFGGAPRPFYSGERFPVDGRGVALSRASGRSREKIPWAAAR